MPSAAFAKFWQVDITRDLFLAYATKDDLCSLRLVSREFADIIASTLFKTININFNVNTFTRRHRMVALDRIGANVKILHFCMSHTEATFLPPLIDPETLEEITFQYEPQFYASRPSSSSSSSAETSESKYGSWETNDILVRQYPPLFHAATNITSFIKAFYAMPCLRQLRISCPDQPAGQRYRRSIIDYALISLRMAIEHANLPFLDTLTLDPVHPSGIFYLRPQHSLGVSPASTRVWNRIKNLNIKMPSFVQGPDSKTDQLKILQTYLQNFRSVESLEFSWIGETKGPNPLSTATSGTNSTSSSRCPSLESFHTTHSINTDISTGSTLTNNGVTDDVSVSYRRQRGVSRLRHLKTFKLHNAAISAIQASTIIEDHRKTLHQVDFDECELTSGTWEEALEPLTRIGEDWKYKGSTVDVMASSSRRERSHKYPSYSSIATTSTAFSTPGEGDITAHLRLKPEIEIMTVPIVFTPTEELNTNPFTMHANTRFETNADDLTDCIREQLWLTPLRQDDFDFFGGPGYYSKRIKALDLVKRVGWRSRELAIACGGIIRVRRFWKTVVMP